MEFDTDEGSSNEKTESETESEENTEETESQQKTQESSKSIEGNDLLALPKIRKLAEEKGVKLSDIKESGRVTEDEVREFDGEKTDTGSVEEEKNQEENKRTESETVSTPEDVNASPYIRQLAREKGVDLSNIEGSGKGGRITRPDIVDSEKNGEESVEEKKTEISDGDRIEMSSTRQTIADRMEKSRFTAPHVTHVEKADITDLVELREDKKEEVEAHLTYLPFIMKATTIALKQYPKLNGKLDEEEDEIVINEGYDFNIAVDTDRGLMTPIIEDVQDHNIIELAEKVTEKARQARDGDLSREDMRNGSFSITNLGVIGGEEFTPIINYPQAAILGIGRISETAEVVDGEVTPRMTVKLSLSYDHRIVDGAEAAKFMNTLVENLEDPREMLMEL